MADEDLMRWLEDDCAPCPDAAAVAAAAAADAECKRKAHERALAAAAASRRRSDGGGIGDESALRTSRDAALAKVRATRHATVEKVACGGTTDSAAENVAMTWTTGADFERAGRAALARGDFAGAAVAFGKASKALPDATSGPAAARRKDLAATLRRRLGHALSLFLTFVAQPSHDLGPTRRNGLGLSIPAEVAADLDVSSKAAVQAATALVVGAGPASAAPAVKVEAAVALALRADVLLGAAQSGRPSAAEIGPDLAPPSFLRVALDAAVRGSEVVESAAQPAAAGADLNGDDGGDGEEEEEGGGGAPLPLSPTAFPNGARDVAVWLGRLQRLIRHVLARREGQEERRAVRELCDAPGTSRVAIAGPGTKAPARFGRTLVAAVDIPRGAVVLCERAMFAFPSCPSTAAQVLAADGLADAASTLSGAAAGKALVLRAWGGAPEGVQAAVQEHFTAPPDMAPDAARDEATAAGWEVLTLAPGAAQRCPRLPPDAAAARRLVALLDNNALASHPDFGLAAVGAVASMAEHSCVPNAHFVLLPCDPGDDGGGGEGATIVFVAARPIAAGERVSVSYVDPAQPLAARRHALRSRYGIASCTCAACTPGSFDTTRPFDCEYCGEGVALPRVTARELEVEAAGDEAAEPAAVWRCCPHFTFGANRHTRPCGRRQSDETAARYSAIERHPEFSRDRPASNVDADSLVHAYAAPGHHLVVRAALAAAGTAQRASPGQGAPPARDLAMRWLSHLLPAAALTSGRAVHLGGWMSAPEPAGPADFDAPLPLALTVEEQGLAPAGYSALDARGRAQVAEGDADPVMAPAKHTADAAAAARLREREERLGLLEARDACPGAALGLLLLAAHAAERDAAVAAGTERQPQPATGAVFDAADLARRAAAVCAACAVAPAEGRTAGSERDNVATIVGASYAGLWADAGTRLAACDASTASTVVALLTAGAVLGP